MSFSTFFNNPFTTFSTNYSSSFSTIDSTYSVSSAGSSPPYSPAQQSGEGEVPDAAMYPLLKPVTASRPVTGTISALLDTQPRPTLISYRNTVPEAASKSAHTPASRSLTRFLPTFGTAPSVTSSGASTPRHGRSRSAGEVLHSDSSARRGRDPSQNLSRREREQEQERWKRKRIEGTHKVVQDLRELSKKEGFHISEEAFNDIIHAAGDLLYRSRQDTPRTTPEMILGDDTGPYAADRAAGRRSSVLTPHELSGKSPSISLQGDPHFEYVSLSQRKNCFLVYYVPNLEVPLSFLHPLLFRGNPPTIQLLGWVIEDLPCISELESSLSFLSKIPTLSSTHPSYMEKYLM